MVTTNWSTRKNVIIAKMNNLVIPFLQKSSPKKWVPKKCMLIKLDKKGPHLKTCIIHLELCISGDYDGYKMSDIT